jgi:hydrogenase small subunit
VWTIASLIAGVMPQLDDYSRPVALFGEPEMVIHKNCPRKGKAVALAFGEEGKCLKELGCKGPRTKADCFSRKWNGGVNWCIGANSVCLGCTEQGFPDRFSPFYKTAF